MTSIHRCRRSLPLLLAAASAAFCPVPLVSGQDAGSEPAGSRLVFPGGRSAGFGEIYQHTAVSHRFTFENRSDVPVRILGTTVVLESGRIEVEPELVPPGGRGEARIEQPVGDRLGEVTFRFGLRTDDPALPGPKLTLGGFVQSAYDPEVGRVELGQLDRSLGATAAFELASREADRLGPVTIAEGPSWLRLTPRGESDGGQRLELEITVAPGAPLGFHVERLLLRTGVPHQPDYVLEVRTAIYGDVVPSEAPIDLGLLRQAWPFEKEITLRSRSGAAVEIAAVDPVPFEVAASACPGPPDPACRLLTLAGRPQLQGPLDGLLRVHLAGDPEPLPLRYSAVVASPDAVVRDLGPLIEGMVVHSDGTVERPESSPAPEPTPAFEEPSPSPGREAPARSEGESGASPVPAEVTLTWSVRQQHRAYGFLVYRSEHREGPYRRVTPETLRTHADREAVGRYRWTDPEVEPGKTYYYYLDAVTKSGQKQRLTGVQAKTVPERAVAGTPAELPAR
jgi:hypothetical protein